MTANLDQLVPIAVRLPGGWAAKLAHIPTTCRTPETLAWLVADAERCAKEESESVDEGWAAKSQPRVAIWVHDPSTCAVKMGHGAVIDLPAEEMAELLAGIEGTQVPSASLYDTSAGVPWLEWIKRDILTGKG
jgi:hypothetical protein